jgi:uncharacterized RDD family membrane protein YckC
MGAAAVNGPPGSEVIGRRCVAALLDLVACFVLAAVIGDALGSSVFPRYTARTLPRNPPAGPYIAAAAVLLVSMLAYWGFCEAVWRRTPGKALFSLRVVSNDGGRASQRQVAARTAARLIDVLPGFYLVGFVALIASGQRAQRLGDRIAHTQVIVDR